MTATPIFSGLDPQVGFNVLRILKLKRKAKRRARKVSHARKHGTARGQTLRCSPISGASPFEQPRQAWLRGSQADYPSMHHPTDYPNSYPRVGLHIAGASPFEQPREAWLRAPQADYPSMHHPTDYPNSYPRVGCAEHEATLPAGVVSGASPYEQPREAWLRGSQADYPSMHHPTDYPNSYPRVGSHVAGGPAQGMSGGDEADVIMGRSYRGRGSQNLEVRQAASDLASAHSGVWLKTRIYQDGHFLKASVYSVTAGNPKVMTLKIDLRPLYRSAVALHRKLMADPKISGDAEQDQAVVGGWWKKLTRKVKRTVKRVAKSKIVRAATWLHRKAYKYAKKYGKKAYIHTTRFAKAAARSNLVPILATGLALFPATTVLGVGMMAAWKTANAVVKASDAVDSAGKHILRDLKRGKLSAGSLMKAAKAGVSVASAAGVKLPPRLRRTARRLKKKGRAALHRFRSLRGRVTKGARRLRKALRSTKRSTRSKARRMFRLLKGKASARGLLRGLSRRKTRRKSAKWLSFMARSKPLSRNPRTAHAQARTATAAKYLSLSRRGKNSFIARIAAKAKAAARALRRRRRRLSASKRAALAGAMSVVSDAKNIARAAHAKRVVRKPRVRRVLRAEAARRRKAQRTIKAIARRARFATGSKRLRARKAAAVLKLAMLNNARIAATVERNRGGVPSMLIDSKGRITPGRYSVAARSTGMNADVLYTGPKKTALTGRFTRVAGNGSDGFDGFDGSEDAGAAEGLVGFAPPAGAYPLEGYWRPGADPDF